MSKHNKPARQLTSNRTRARGIERADGRWVSPFRMVLAVRALGWRPEAAGLRF